MRQAQVANLEFLLLNHPLDCPVCDRGGECPLQDQALAYGPGESRFTEAKRDVPEADPDVAADRAGPRAVRAVRAVHAVLRRDQRRPVPRAVRAGRGRAGRRSPPARTSARRSRGNVVQICPVGALTATPVPVRRAPVRPHRAPTRVCRHCSAGCNVRVDLRRGEVVRVLARENPEVNDAWICDKGRFAFGHDDAAGRITTPLDPRPRARADVVRRGADRGRRRVPRRARRRARGRAAARRGRLRAVEARAHRAADQRPRPPPGAARRLGRACGPPPAPMAVTYRDIERRRRDRGRRARCRAGGADPASAAAQGRARAAHGSWSCTARRTRLHDVAEHVLVRPGAEAAALAAIAAGTRRRRAPAPRSRRRRRTAGSSWPARGSAEHDGAADAAARGRASAGARFAWSLAARAITGALRAGVHPALCPGGRRLDVAEERAELEAVWGPVDDRGRRPRRHRDPARRAPSTNSTSCT